MENPPLINDPRREAVDTMHGFASQIWRSVLIWLRLRPSERMYLEGAEDIDVVEGTAAEAIQAKAVTASITLRSQDVVDAIDNIWAHQKRNPDRSVRLRFLTTSSPGVEQKNPFGSGLPGLQIWERARLAAAGEARDHDVVALRTFLLDEKRVGLPVQEFLENAEADAIWDRLISRLEWDTDASDMPEIKAAIAAELLAIGEQYQVTAREAEKVAAHLYDEAWAVATSHANRWLERADALRIFDRITHVSMPQATLNTLLQMLLPNVSGFEPSSMPSVVLPRGAKLISRPHSLPARHLGRGGLVSEMISRMNLASALLLHGGTGAGKSTLATEYVAASGSEWGWADFRGVDEQMVARRLSLVAGELEHSNSIAFLVLDDVEIPRDHRLLSGPLGQIAAILRGRHGALLVTSSEVLPQRVTQALETTSESIFHVPPFSREDICNFLVQRGCADAHRADQWAKIVYLHTAGHPQLVHARIAALEIDEFPQPTATDLTETPSDVVEARAEARRLLEQLNHESRELIYRLSVTTLVMARRQIIAIANQEPPIPDPGLAFDKLVGPWMEGLPGYHYRISPLVRNVGADIRGNEWAKGANRAVARGLLADHTLTPWDVSFVLMHGTVGEDWSLVGRLTVGIIHADADVWREIAEAAEWFLCLGLGEGVKSPATTPFNLFLIRLFQYRLASARGDTSTAEAVIARFERDVPPNEADAAIQICRHFFTGLVLIRDEIQLEVRQMVQTGIEHILLSDNLDKELLSTRETISEPALKGPDGLFDFGSIAGFMLLKRVDSRTTLRELFAACEKQAITLVRRLLWFIGGTEAVAWGVMTRVWVAELRNPESDWNDVQIVFRQAYDFGRKFDLPGLAQGAARAMARLADEISNDPEEALRVGSTIASEIGWTPGLEDGQAIILARKGDFAGALAIWRRVLPPWERTSDFDIQQTFSCREAAIAAARIGQWGEAADWLRVARSRIGREANHVYEAGLLIDEGFAHWMASNHPQALSCLEEGLRAIDALPSDDDSEPAYLLRKRAGHTIMWVASIAGGIRPKDFSEPPPACCSSLNPVSAPRQPSTAGERTWAQLLEFEQNAGLGDRLLRQHEARLGSSTIGGVRVQIAALRLQDRLRTLALSDIVSVVTSYCVELIAFTNFYKNEGHDMTEPIPESALGSARATLPRDLILGLMLGAVIASVARGEITTSMVDDWRADASAAGLSIVLDPWLDILRSLFITHTANAWDMLRDGKEDICNRMLASVHASADASAEPASLLTVHAFCVRHFLPLQTLPLPFSDIHSLIIAGWSRLAGPGAFRLRAPNYSVPELQRAFASPSMGWRKIGEVLIAAANATPATVSDDMRRVFLDLLKD